MFFLLSFIALLKNVSTKKSFFVYAFVFLFLVADIPLIRWAGNISLHGLTYQFYFPQFFGISLLLFILWLNEQHANGVARILPLVFSFNLVLMLSHPLTGLLSLFLTLFRLAVLTNQPISEKLRTYISLAILPAVATVAWPFYPVYLTFKSTRSYELILLMLGGVLALLFLTKRESLGRRLDWLTGNYKGVKNIVFYFTIVALAYVLYNLHGLPDYFRYKDVSIWWFAYLPLMGGLAAFFYPEVRKRPLLLLLWVWGSGCMMGYLLGLAGLPVKVYWRFLLLAKIPLAILVAYTWANTEMPSKFSLRVKTLAAALLGIGVIHQLYVMQHSSMANYFKQIPLEYKIAEKLSNENDSTILSDPFTSYFLAGLTNNDVYAVDTDRISDYDQHIFEKHNMKAQQFFESKSEGDFKKILEDGRVDYIVVNTTVSFTGDSTKVARSAKPRYSNSNGDFLPYAELLHRNELFHIYKVRD